MYFDVNKAKKVRSFYQDYNTLGPYSISASPIETDDPMDLVAAVLSEFGQSTAEQKAIFKELLEILTNKNIISTEEQIKLMSYLY